MANGLTTKFPPTSLPIAEFRKRSNLTFHLLLLGLAIAGGLVFQVAGPAWALAIFGHVELGTIGGVAALLTALLVSIVAHELGHLCTAILLNYEVVGGALGPLRFERSHRATIFSYTPEDWARCYVSAVPREMGAEWRQRTMAVVAAGPAFTLLLLIISVCIALTRATWLTPFWSCCAEVNFLIFVLGLFPNTRFGGPRNDAALFRALYQNAADALDIFTCHRAIQLGLRGIRPEDYPEPLLLELACFNWRPYTNLLVARRMMEWAIDSGDLKLASAWDEHALANSKKCTARERNIALAESACFDVLFRHDRLSAGDKFAAVNFETLFPPSLAERARAARLLACESPSQAPAHILRAQYHLPLGIPYYDYERKLLSQLHAVALAQFKVEALGYFG
jgi:hypothetical protein